MKENEFTTNRKLNVLIAKLEHEKYFVVNHNQTFDKLSRVQQKTIAKKTIGDGGELKCIKKNIDELLQEYEQIIDKVAYLNPVKSSYFSRGFKSKSVSLECLFTTS